ncbi:response regulator [Dactylosporangium siamense]|uniref:DNA-binding response regulator n=1 Tax=Dactylosporangium siamense TaxID=685454 RepID=A0A919PHE2_9ACTN|nr:response regulator transcription factor [Dactylosporangium siamense]GIG43412.1 DNA-binding response regulator [Dactylosporangium siamense]
MISVLLAEDQHLIRGALAALLRLEADITVVAEVGDGDAVVGLALRTRPDVAVLDLGLPGRDGLSAAIELRSALPSCRSLLVTGVARPGDLRRAMAAHVAGFLLKHATPEQMTDAIRRLAAGQRVIDPALAVLAWETPDNPLTERELQVLRLAATGAPAADIARQLFLSVGTVRNHLTAAATKLHARNRVDAIRIATETGWL